MDELLDHHKPLDQYIGEYAERQSQAAAALGATNHNIHETKLGSPGFTDVPRCMFFYYVRVNTDGTLEVSHYFYPNGDPEDSRTWKPIDHDRDALTTLVRNLARNARPGAPQPKNPPQIGKNFEDIAWDRKSYIAIFFDEHNWKFHKFSSGGTEDPAVVFITEKKNGKTGTANHSFFDAMDLDINMSLFDYEPADVRSAIAFINHMKGDEDGNDIGAEQQFFQFKMFLDVNFASGAKALTVIIDPDGNNLGPPNPPPP